MKFSICTLLLGLSGVSFSSPADTVQSRAGLVAILFPNYLVPLKQAEPTTAQGTQYTGDVSWANSTANNEITLIVGFDVPDNAATSCALKFRLPESSQSTWNVTGHGTLVYYGLSRPVDHVTDTWSKRPERSPGSPLGQIQVIPNSEGVVTGTFVCRKNTRIDFELVAERKGPTSVHWFELQVPKTGITLEMWS